MSAPKTPEELARRIESLVAAYVSEAERVAQAALSHSFSNAHDRPGKKSTPASAKPSTPNSRQQSSRRTPQQLADLADQLAARVVDQPGESMASFAKHMGVSVRDMHRPMTMLKDQGRVRSVGQRTLTRYFPAAQALASA